MEEVGTLKIEGFCLLYDRLSFKIRTHTLFVILEKVIAEPGCYDTDEDLKPVRKMARQIHYFSALLKRTSDFADSNSVVF